MASICAFTDNPGESVQTLLLCSEGGRKYKVYLISDDMVDDVSVELVAAATEPRLIQLNEQIPPALKIVMATNNSIVASMSKMHFSKLRLAPGYEWPFEPHNLSDFLGFMRLLRAMFWMRYMTMPSGMRNVTAMTPQQCFDLWQLDSHAYIRDDAITGQHTYGMYLPTRMIASNSVQHETDMKWGRSNIVANIVWKSGSDILPYYAGTWETESNTRTRSRARQARRSPFHAQKVNINDRAIIKHIVDNALCGADDAEIMKFSPVLDGTRDRPYNPFEQLARITKTGKFKSAASYHGLCVHMLVTLYTMKHIHGRNAETGLGQSEAERMANTELIALLTSTAFQYPRICKAAAMACVINIFDAYADEDRLLRWVGSDLPLIMPGIGMNDNAFLGVYPDLVFMYGGTCIVVDIEPHWSLPVAKCKSYKQLDSRTKGKLDSYIDVLMAQATTLRWAYRNCDTLWKQTADTPMTVQLAVVNIPCDDMRPAVVHIISTSTNLPTADDEWSTLTNEMVATVLHAQPTEVFGYFGHNYVVPKNSAMMAWVIMELLAESMARIATSQQQRQAVRAMQKVYYYIPDEERAPQMRLLRDDDGQELEWLTYGRAHAKTNLVPTYVSKYECWLVPFDCTLESATYVACPTTDVSIDTKDLASEAGMEYNEAKDTYFRSVDRGNPKTLVPTILMLPNAGTDSTFMYLAYLLSPDISVRDYVAAKWKSVFPDDTSSFAANLAGPSVIYRLAGMDIADMA